MSYGRISDFNLAEYGEEINIRVCPECMFSVTDVTWALIGCGNKCPSCGTTSLGEFEFETMQKRAKFNS